MECPCPLEIKNRLQGAFKFRMSLCRDFCLKGCKDDDLCPWIDSLEILESLYLSETDFQCYDSKYVVVIFFLLNDICKSAKGCVAVLFFESYIFVYTKFKNIFAVIMSSIQLKILWRQLYTYQDYLGTDEYCELNIFLLK